MYELIEGVKNVFRGVHVVLSRRALRTLQPIFGMVAKTIGLTQKNAACRQVQ
jgi:hypothetical protein